MTHHDDTIFPAPAHLHLVPGVDGAAEEVGDIRLVVAGQGTVAFALADPTPFSVTIGDAGVWGSRAFRWDVGYDDVALFEWRGGAWESLPLLWESGLLVAVHERPGIDPEPTCKYWFSIDSHNRRLSYGTGETRLKTVLATHPLSEPAEGAHDVYQWLARLTHVHVTPPLRLPADVWRDPVTVDPAMKVVPTDSISMDDMASGEVTVPENLTAVGQTLYANVAGKRFVLDTDDFEDFGDAIQASIDNKAGWCHKKLKEKASEFGADNPDMTYLRITMGLNQGESPGIPFVMEIWPYGHYSPIHNHSAADAVIRVLRGEISVSLYRMLSSHHVDPFMEATFAKDDVTWISPTLNQTHKLMNNQPAACITIQCYTYPKSDAMHYPYFDYLEQSSIGHFTPNSDMDYLDFKALMHDEWLNRPELVGATSSPAEQ